jgi:hypothetical protein
MGVNGAAGAGYYVKRQRCRAGRHYWLISDNYSYR